MTGDRHQVDVHLVDVYWHFSKSLRGIRVEKRLVRLADLTNFFQRLHDSDFIVDVDDRAHQSVGPHCGFHFLEINQASRKLDWEISDFEAFVLEAAAAVQDTFVVDLSRYNVFLLVAVEHTDAFQAQIVAFRGA